MRPYELKGYFKRLNSLKRNNTCSMHSEIRRLIEISGSYYVAIPKPWARALRLNKGSNVEIFISKEGLIIRPYVGNKELSKPKCIRLRAYEGIERRIIAAYLKGYDIIEIMHEKNIPLKYKKKIDNITNLLIGLEIVREDSKTMLLECLWIKKEDVWGYIKRMDYIARSMYRDAIIALINRDKELAQEVIKRDDKVDKLYFLVVRMIRSLISDIGFLLSRSLDPINLLDYRLIARNIEEIADYSENIASKVLSIISGDYHSISSHIDNLKEMIEKLERLEISVLRAYEEYDTYKAMKITNTAEDIRVHLANFIYNLVCSEKPKAILVSLVDDLLRIVDLLSDIGDLIA